MDTPSREIKERLNIVDVVGQYVRLQKAGANYKGLCPFHNEKTPSFTVNEEKQMWHCFGCSKGGDVFSFFMEMENVGFREALTVLAERAGVTLPQYNGDEKEGEKPRRTYEILELATRFYEKQLWEGEGMKQALPYLIERGLSRETLRAFRVGYAPSGWENMQEFLTKKEYTVEEREKTGLFVKKASDAQVSMAQARYYDRFRDRIMFPIMDVLGRVLGYSARVLPGEDEKHAKYINTPETDIYHKSHVLYGIFQAKKAMKDSGAALVVEGNMDVLALFESEFPHSIAVSGTALTQDHLRVLSRYVSTLLLFFDMDTAGQSAAQKSIISGLQKELDVFVVSIQEGKDAAELAKENPEALKKAISQAVPAMEYVSQVFQKQHDLSTAQGKKRFSKDISPFLKSVKNAVEREHWSRRIADLLAVDTRIIYEMLSSEEERFIPENNRREQKVSQNEERKTVVETGEERAILSLCALLMIHPKIWKEIIIQLKEEQMEFFDFLRQNTVFAYVADSGDTYKYDFEILRHQLKDEIARKRLEDLYFSHISMNKSKSEDGDVSAEGQVKEVLESLRRVFQKNKRRSIEFAMRKAENEGEKETVQQLLKELSALSK